ncbi:MAG TPA: tyrosine--tRNA ligase [Patescibacteria group bacterium]|nr:tyrosine--tRNA ligase [Patescibacteria group bacterium]
MKNNINNKGIEELVTRGVEEVYPDKASLEKKLKSGEKIKLYCGFDPSAKSLHIGHAILINKLAQFQKLGHEVIFLIGDFTGMIGDPTDKSSVRKKLSREEVLVNSKDYQKQASSFLDFEGKNSAVVKYNSEWNDKLNFKDLIELSSHFTVQQMLQRDMFQKRQEEEKPIYLHEFLYPLTQAYDTVAMDIDLEIGGNDQMFNMMCGRDLIRTLKNKEKFVLTMKLLADENGKKMGKSEGNAVFLDEEASEIYGKVMSWPDKFMSVAFELCTQTEWQEVKEIQKELKTKDANFRDIKMKLAKEITASIKGVKEAQSAEEYFVKTIQKKEVPDNIEELSLKKDSLNILELLVLTKLTTSKGEARRLINQSGVKIDGELVSAVDLEVNLDKTRLIQKGKRHFLKVKK